MADVVPAALPVPCGNADRRAEVDYRSQSAARLRAGSEGGERKWEPEEKGETGSCGQKEPDVVTKTPEVVGIRPEVVWKHTGSRKCGH